MSSQAADKRVEDRSLNVFVSWGEISIPLEELSWKNVINTCTCFQGFCISPDLTCSFFDGKETVTKSFYVQYAIGNSVFEIHNEIEFNQAILWSQEQQTSLDLRIPFKSTEEQLDEDFYVVNEEEENDLAPVNKMNTLPSTESETQSLEDHEKSIDHTENVEPENSNVVCCGCAVNPALALRALQLGYRSDLSEDILGPVYQSCKVENLYLCKVCHESKQFESIGPYIAIKDSSQSSQDDDDIEDEELDEEDVDEINPKVMTQNEDRSNELIERNKLNTLHLESTNDNQEVIILNDANNSQSRAEGSTLLHDSSSLHPCKEILKAFRTRHEGFRCDCCGIIPNRNSICYGCRKCNFDICSECQARLQLPNENAPKSHEAKCELLSDVTLPSEATALVGEKLEKIWRVKNSGVSMWPYGTYLRFFDGNSFHTDSIMISVLAAEPNEIIDISLPVMMPLKPGKYTGCWCLFAPGEPEAFSLLPLNVRVTSAKKGSSFMSVFPFYLLLLCFGILFFQELKSYD